MSIVKYNHAFLCYTCDNKAKGSNGNKDIKNVPVL